jgi:hypothetical protein
VFPLLLALAALLAVPAPPAPDGPLPTSVPAVAQQLQDVDAGLSDSVAAWQTADPRLASPAAPEDVQLWALRQQRLLMALRDSPTRATSVVSRLPGALRRSTQSTLVALMDLRRLSPAHPPKRRWKVAPALPAGTLRGLYRDAQRRTGVAWHVLAAVNFVESDFNKLQNESIVGAQGPMQFMPSPGPRTGAVTCTIRAPPSRPPRASCAQPGRRPATARRSIATTRRSSTSTLCCATRAGSQAAGARF